MWRTTLQVLLPYLACFKLHDASIIIISIHIIHTGCPILGGQLELLGINRITKKMGRLVKESSQNMLVNFFFFSFLKITIVSD